MRRKGTRRREWRDKERERGQEGKQATREAQPKSLKGTQAELGRRRAHKNPEETATEKSKGEDERKTEASPENQEGREEQGNPQGRHQQQEILKFPNPTRGRQRKQKEDLPGKDPKREAKDKGSEGGPRSKENTRDRVQGGRRQEGRVRSN